MTLASGIAKASADVGGRLKADKTNTQDRYEYISANKILAECGQALAAQGVSLIPSITEADIVMGTTAGGKNRYDARVKFLMTLTDGTETTTLDWFGFGADYTTPDKAIYKAITSGHKYFLSKLLCIGEGNEDGEHESEPSPKPQPQPQQPAPASKRASQDKSSATLDWSAGIWDEYVQRAVEGEWKPPTDQEARKLSDGLRRAVKPDCAFLTKESAADVRESLDDLVGEQGGIVVLSALAGWGRWTDVPEAAGTYLLGVAGGQYPSAKQVLVSFAKNLHESEGMNA